MMIKVIMTFCSFLLFIGNVFATENINIDYYLDNNKYVLYVTINDERIEYAKAVKNYDLDEYMMINIDGTYYYFYLGNEITKEQYEVGIEKTVFFQECEDNNANCIFVSSTNEIIKKMEELYSSNESSVSYLVYGSFISNSIDFEKINSYFVDNIVGDNYKNMYKYKEYYFRAPIKTLPYHDENKMIIDLRSVKTNDEEVAKVDEFLDVFLKLFDNKSDYEKILGAYTYINNTAKYESDDGYINFMDGQLSAYDVLIKHKTVCIGAATTFQLIMERLGVESYIIDHVQSNTDDEYVTTHTYNIVKLEDKWYIVDISFDDKLSGLLKGISDNYSLEDFKYYNIEIANKNYFDEHPSVNKKFDFDYAKLLDLTEKIDRKESRAEKDNKLGDKKSYLKEYILIGVILIVILGIIYIFTRKK